MFWAILDAKRDDIHELEDVIAAFVDEIKDKYLKAGKFLVKVMDKLQVLKLHIDQKWPSNFEAQYKMPVLYETRSKEPNANDIPDPASVKKDN